MIHDHPLSPATRFKGKYVDFCETQSSASLCELKMQKMRVDCCFLLSKTRWGHLHGKDAGVMYLDLTFHQPAKCKLSHATITLDFHEAEGSEKSCSGLPEEPPHLEVTEFFGPQMLTAEKRERLVSTTLEANPTVGIGGATFQGVRFARSSIVSYASCWQFEGSRFAPDSSPIGGNSRNSRYRRLVWHLQENELEKQAVQQNTVHSAVAFTHQSKPFYLDVKIEAKLQRWHDRVKQKLVCPPRNRKTRARATIQTSTRKATNAEFAKLAMDLNKSMTDANLHPVTDNDDEKASPGEKEDLDQLDPVPSFSDEFLALVGRHNGESPPDFLSGGQSNSTISTSRGHSESVLLESSDPRSAATQSHRTISTPTESSESVLSVSTNSGSTLVGEDDAKDTQTDPVDSTQEQPAEPELTGEENIDDIEEFLSMLWQASKSLALWTAALITLLIAGLQSMQVVLAQEKEFEKNTSRSRERARNSDDHEL